MDGQAVSAAEHIIEQQFEFDYNANLTLGVLIAIIYEEFHDREVFLVRPHEEEQEQ